ncbi:hypothetical protein [Novosphingobium sp. MMS21-SN21R]|uniref:hypothetical protein n=1 Tax=Novosphingobium sp. MMS21-SN21R TaxID=2969298 RepID=UPI00288425FD|nr:hypothetical protein [Novosphingobium sp. MMS21-SN21R]MDT0509018.1 hypothetical protein [Novosphingobium sp. MMS21-SN21R]
MRPLTSSDLADLALYPASLQQSIVALCGVATGSTERGPVPVTANIYRRPGAANTSTGFRE